MQDKNILINSMNNLIKYHNNKLSHISISRKNQQQMFASLTRSDFQKIITNLEDSLLKLRITTVQLLTQLLYNNLQLKQKFCQLMNIKFSFNSNLVLNNNLKKVLQKNPKKEKDLFLLLKSHARVSQQNLTHDGFGGEPPLLWFINPRSQRSSVQYIYRQQICDILSTLNSNNSLEQLNFDPLQCIFGITISEQELNQSVEIRVPTSSSVTTQSSKARSTIKNNIMSRQENGSLTPRHTVQHYVPISTKNSSFQKNNKTSIFSFTYEPFSKGKTPKHEQPKGFKQKQTLNSSLDLNIKRNKNLVNSLNSPTNFEHLQNSQNKNSNQQTYLLVQNDKFNRLSLQLNELKSQKRNYTISAQSGNGNQYSNIKPMPTHSNEHQHGIKLTTPRNSLMNSKKISIINSSFTNGSQTDRIKTQKLQSLDKQPSESYTPINTQKIKTIHLGRGTRAPETVRDKKNIKIQRH